MEDLTGKQFGHYQIVAPLGEGGMAAVYKAYQPAMERYVAVKVLPRQMASTEEFLERFRREAKMLAKLQHPHILPVFDYGEQDGYPYIVMPLIQSGTLSESLHNTQIPLPEINRLITQIGTALGYAHAHGMIHRDVKPSNVLVDEGGNCLLTDFGLARMMEGSAKLTSSGAIMGTPSYMSPEQGTGETLDHRSDIYSLGVILYEMITGRVPYSAETPIAVILKHIKDPLPPVRKFNPTLPESVELVLLKALAKKPEDRYQSTDEFVNALQKAIAEATSDVSTTLAPKTLIAKPPTVIKSPPTTAKEKHPTAAKEKRPGVLTAGRAIILFLVIGALGMIFLMARLTGKNKNIATETASGPLSLLPAATETVTARPTVEPSPSPMPTPTELSAVITDPKNVTMVLVPAGEFTMGNTLDQSLAECTALFPTDAATNCKSEYFSDETPPHQVYLDAFYIDKYEVTNLLYKACVDAGVCKAPAQKTSETVTVYYGSPAYENYPVIWVDWNMAKTYCEWRGARLPTEAEWEKAARGTIQQTYPWGQSFDASRANSCDTNCPKKYANKNFNDTYGDTAPVDAFPSGVSVFGAFNLSGNVSEWVADWYSADYYSSSSSTSNPPGPQNGEKHIIRGGSWLRFPINLRLVTRSSQIPDYTSNDVGFRCAYPIP